MDYDGEDRNIYLSEKIDRSTWSTPIPLTGINTLGNDVAPYLIDDKYLFFSTDGLQGYGGKDIYVCKRMRDHSWSEWTAPLNLGPVFNDQNDNVYFHYSKMRNMAYLTMGEHSKDMDIAYLNFFIEEELFSKLDDAPVCHSRYFYQEEFNASSATAPAQKCFEYQILELEQQEIEGREFIWHFGDGTIGYGITTEHCYESPGNYMVNFSMMENTTLYQFDYEYNFEVNVLKDIALKVNWGETTATPSRHKSFYARINNLPEQVEHISYYWNFGDGNYACGPAVEHDYQYGESFDVKVTVVFDLDGQQLQLTSSHNTKVKVNL